MPKVRRQGLPTGLVEHLRERVFERQISIEDLRALLAWLETEPIVPPGSWFKRFPRITVCGRGELVLTFLTADQTPIGIEL